MTDRAPADTQPQDHSRAEQRRQSSARIAISYFRLAKACSLHESTNDAVVKLVAPVAAAVAEFCHCHETDTARWLFSGDMVFINRRILRGSRETYALALQLGSLLQGCKLNEITFDRSITIDTIARTARLVVEGQRSPAAAATLRDTPWTGLSLRLAPDIDSDSNTETNESPVARVVRRYAAAILVLQCFYAQLAAGDARGSHEVKRVAQKLVALSETHLELLVATAAGPLTDDDRARRAVSTAVLAIAMARILTENRSTLTTVALAALLADCGEIRLGADEPPDLIPTRAFLTLAAIGEFHEASLRRSVVVHEVLRMSNSDARTSSSPELPKTGLADLLSIARRFNELRTPMSGAPRPSLDDAIRQLDAAASSAGQKTLVRLLVSGMGFYPVGTVVELDSGEIALVTGVPSSAVDFARPPIHLMTDSGKHLLSKPVELDLARQQGPAPKRAIRAPLDIESANALHSSVAPREGVVNGATRPPARSGR